MFLRRCVFILLVSISVSACLGGGGGGSGSGSGSGSGAISEGEGGSGSVNPSEEIQTPAPASPTIPSPSVSLLDTDGDGVSDDIDVFPENADISRAVLFDLDEVVQARISESLSDGAVTRTVLNLPQEPEPSLWAVFRAALMPKAWAQVAEETELSNETNLTSIDSEGEVVEDAILSNEPFFVSETILSPDAQFLYMITDKKMQLSISGLEPEVCQLYRVDLKNDDNFECLMGVTGDDPELFSINISNSLRDDYMRDGITFRADGTGLMQAHMNQVLLHPDGTWEIIRSGKTGYRVEDELGFWLDDAHVAIRGHIGAENNQVMEQYLLAINLDTRQVVDEIDGAGGIIVQTEDTLYDEIAGAYRWENNQFVAASSFGQSIVQDRQGRLWAFNEISDPDAGPLSASTLTEVETSKIVTLAASGALGYAESLQSGTGTDVKYKQFDFTEDYVLHKYILLPETPIEQLNGTVYDGNTVYNLGGDDGHIVTDMQAKYWFYFRSGNEIDDVAVPYLVDIDGTLTAKSFTIPLSALNEMASRETDIYVPTDANINQTNEHLAIQIPTPESQRMTFCLFVILNEQQICADLSDYDVLTTDFESIRGPRNDDPYFPDSFRAYPNTGLRASPGIQNVVLSNEDIIVFFKDSSDNQYYSAKADISSFITDPDNALTFAAVQNGAGESEILARANQIKAEAQSAVSVTANVNGNSISVDFGTPLSSVASLPTLYITDANGDAVSSDGDIDWNDGRQLATISYASGVLASGQSYDLKSEDWVFLPDTSLRHGLSGQLVLTIPE